jgi:uncharacterized tellurite resistance protein B-like protein
MLNIMQRFFKPADHAMDDSGDSSSAHDVNVATCALLLEIAQIDGEFSNEEKENIIEILKKEYQLSDDYIQEITKIAKQELKESHDLWKFTNLINNYYDQAEKIRIIEIIWKVVYSDGNLDKHEDYLVHKLSRLLNLRHSELINAKLKAIYPE